MQPRRFTLNQVMVIIAIIGVVFAVSPVPLAIAFSSILLILGGISALIRVPWFRFAAWAFSCYPLLFLASMDATWWAAWLVLGHPPRESLDDPRTIGPLVNSPYFATSVLITGFLPALLVHLILAVIELLRAIHDENEGLNKRAARAGLPLLTWPLTFSWVKADPGNVVAWFMD